MGNNVVQAQFGQPVKLLAAPKHRRGKAGFAMVIDGYSPLTNSHQAFANLLMHMATARKGVSKDRPSP